MDTLEALRLCCFDGVPRTLLGLRPEPPWRMRFESGSLRAFLGRERRHPVLAGIDLTKVSFRHARDISVGG